MEKEKLEFFTKKGTIDVIERFQKLIGEEFLFDNSKKKNTNYLIL